MSKKLNILDSMLKVLIFGSNGSTTKKSGPTRRRETTSKTGVKVYALFTPVITQDRIEMVEKYASIVEFSSKKSLSKDYEITAYSPDGVEMMQTFLRQSLKERIEEGSLKVDELPSWWKTV